MAKRSSKKRSSKSAGSLGGVSTAELAREIRRRERQLDKLEGKKSSLLAQVDELDSEIATLSGLLGRTGSARRTGASGPRRRPRNEQTLTEALAGVLSGVTMSVTEAAEAVQQAGYKTSAENFRTIVNQTLLREKKTFKKVARGQYTAK